MMPLRLCCVLAISAGFCLSQPPQKPTIDFQREIRPILSENCFQCHGPDAGTRMAGLRLDLKESAMAVVKGKSAESLLYQRISATDAARRMPPEASDKSLNAA